MEGIRICVRIEIYLTNKIFLIFCYSEKVRLLDPKIFSEHLLVESNSIFEITASF